jgi:hypothetical protein
MSGSSHDPLPRRHPPRGQHMNTPDSQHSFAVGTVLAALSAVIPDGAVNFLTKLGAALLIGLASGAAHKLGSMLAVRVWPKKEK